MGCVGRRLRGLGLWSTRRQRASPEPRSVVSKMVVIGRFEVGCPVQPAAHDSDEPVQPTSNIDSPDRRGGCRCVTSPRCETLIAIWTTNSQQEGCDG